MDARCAAIGRDQANLRRSYLMFDPTARFEGGVIVYYQSEEIFMRMVQQVIALGISEGLCSSPVSRDNPLAF